MSSSKTRRDTVHATQNNVKATNQTATAFLGGRARPWMQNGLSVNAGDARSTTRAVQSPGAQGRPVSSDGAVLSNQTLQKNDGSRASRPTQSDHLLVQVPSDTSNSTQALQQTDDPGAPQLTRSDYSAQVPTHQAQAVQKGSSSFDSEASILPSPALTNESSPPANTHRASPGAQPDSLNPTARTSIQYHTAAFAPITESGLSSTPNQATSQAAAPAPPIRVSARTPTLQDVVTFTGPPAMSPARPQSREHGHGPDKEKRSRDAEHESTQPSKRPRNTSATPSNAETMQQQSGIQSYVPRVEAKIRALGNQIETNRVLQVALKGLREACLNSDEFYVLVHQLLHVWLIDRNQACMALARAPIEPPDIHCAFSILSSLLDYTGNAGDRHRIWFATFPETSVAMSSARMAPDQMSLIARFLSNLATKWEQYVHRFRQKEIPATSYIMTHQFQCRSPLLRQMFYLFTRRGFVPDDYATDLNEHWQMEDYAEQAALSGIGNQKQLAGLRGLNESRYKKLIQAYRVGQAATPQQVQSYAVPHAPQQQPLPSGHQPHWPHRNNVQQQVHAQQQPAPWPQNPQPPGQWAQLPNPAQPTSAQQGFEPWQMQRQLEGQGQRGIGAPQHHHVTHGQPNRLHHVQNAPHQTHQCQNCAQHSPHQQIHPAHAQYTHQLNHQVAHVRLDHFIPSQSQPQVQRAQQTWQQRDVPRPRGHHVPGAAMMYNGPEQPQPQSQPIHSPSLHEASSPSLRSPMTTNTPTMAAVTDIARPTGIGGSSTRSNAALEPIGLGNSARQDHVAPDGSAAAARTSTQVGPAFVPPSNAAAAQQQLPTVPSPISTPTVQQRTVPGPRRTVRVIPPHRYPVTGPNTWETVQMAAHLPQLRSPSRKPTNGSAGRHYQYIEGFAVAPVLVGAATRVKALEFDVSAAQLAALPTKAVDHSGLPVRLFSHGTYRWRLRCLTQSGPDSDKVCMSDWAVLPNSWPAECYVQINDQPIQLGRKQHFKRDLPAELSDFLIEGRNKVKISVPKNKKNVAGGLHFFFAVECVVTRQHDDLVQSITTRHTIDAEQTKDAIAQRLQAAHDDEEVAFASNDLTVSLADPFSSLQFTVPVRGKACKHLECFDLTHWLNTRSGKKTAGRTSAEEPSAVDEWKCPICGADARPSTLVVDLFLKGVRDSLVEAGRPMVKSIQVAADGAWTAVDEPDDLDTDDGEQTSFAAARQVNKSTVIEILDDG